MLVSYSETNNPAASMQQTTIAAALFVDSLLPLFHMWQSRLQHIVPAHKLTLMPTVNPQTWPGASDDEAELRGPCSSGFGYDSGAFPAKLQDGPWRRLGRLAYWFSSLQAFSSEEVLPMSRSALGGLEGQVVCLPG
jgi:hypothetical protein